MASPQPSEPAGMLKSTLARLLREAIQADLSMHRTQVEAWQWFAQHLPKGELINDDLHEGLPRNLYLALSDLSFTFHVKPKSMSFWNRLSLAFKLLFNRVPGLVGQPLVYVFSSPSDQLATKVDMKISRFKNGTVAATYSAADPATAELLRT